MTDQEYYQRAIWDFKDHIIQSYDYIALFDAMKIGCKEYGLTIKDARQACKDLKI